MMCSGCFKDQQEGYCNKCLKELFGGKKISPYLSFTSPNNEPSELFFDNTKKISISGVQVKYSLMLDDGKLRLTDTNGTFILKPIPVGQFKHLDQAPANEHLTMQIAKQVYKLSVPPNAIVYFQDGSPAYLVKRFDRSSEGVKYQQEDFAQIAQISTMTHGENYKYDLSYEEVASLIKEYIATHRIELEKFFQLVLFNYVFSNGDAHMKNFSAIETTQGDYVLTPAYDLLCTRIHSPSESDMALSLFKDGFSDAYEAYGFYTYQDFLLFGKQIGIKETRVKKIISIFSNPKSEVDVLVDRSFLKPELKELYKKLYLDKVKRLGMGLIA